MNRPPKATEVTTASCRLISLSTPKPKEVSITDIAHHLATINRFYGAPPVPYSVAQHSVVVAQMMMDDPKAALHGLLHDAHEAYIGDVIDPLARRFSQCGRDDLSWIKHDIDECILEAIGLNWPNSKIAERVKHADMVAFQTEFRDVMPDGAVPPRGPAPLSTTIKPQPWPKAEESFLDMWRKLARLNGIEETIR